LYRDFCQTYDTRQGDEIRRLIRGVLQAIVEEAHDRPAAEAIAARLEEMHQRLGIPILDLKLAPAKERKRVRKAG
jgi:hypothetical protein